MESDDGSFLVGTGGGAARFDPYGQDSGALFSPLPPPLEARPNQVRAVMAAPDAVWIGTDAGLFVIRNGVAKIVSLVQGTDPPGVNSLARDLNGNVWVGTSAALYVVGADGSPIQLLRNP